MKNTNYIHHAPYLKNSIIEYDHDFWHTFCKVLIPPGIFFHFFKMLIFWVVSGVKEQKMTENDKKYLSVALHVSGTIDHMIAIFVDLCKMTISPGVFFNYFFKILIVWVTRRVKGQNIFQNEKSVCLSYSISQEPYII